MGGITSKGGGGVPIGASLPYHGGAVPVGYLLEYGQVVNIADYPLLFAAIGAVYGGDGVTTFGIPDSRGRAIFGKDDMGGAAANRLTSGGGGVNGAALGAVGGGQTVTLTSGQMPSHSHTQDTNNAGANAALGTAAWTSGKTTKATAAAGSGGAHGNMPPALVANMMIRAI